MNYITEIRAFMDLVEYKQLSTGQIALWYALMHINNKCSWIEWFTAPNKRLELLTGLSRSAILKNRNMLKQLGLIDFRANGTSATSYTIAKSEQPSEQESKQGSEQPSKQQSNTLNKLNKTKLSNKEYKESFNEFWNIYPKKVAKQDAQKAWDKLKPDDEMVDEIIAGVAWLRKSPQWTEKDGKFIPNPATFLNGGRWNDETEVKFKNPTGGK